MGFSLVGSHHLVSELQPKLRSYLFFLNFVFLYVDKNLSVRPLSGGVFRRVIGLFCVSERDLSSRFGIVEIGVFYAKL